ncbi:NDP-hexose 2,3-dehydratase family protein [Streptomyces noursei]|uniref:NDP-hexose 2,3-dehydratase family protein n=1 Tax=Streptomyces TaxID=1883 RepID=UPI001F21C4D9|nr:NDP-hexose 2,3-dehydratase family protein [Streptomyces noursei]MCE4942227.1 NDP-hexose 2,3-dehydratase family protein [Streptomyces noursei]
MPSHADASHAAPPTVRPRADATTAERFARSAAALEPTAPAAPGTPDVPAWLGRRRRAHDFRVERIPLADLEGWTFAPTTGNLGHHSGKFFTVEGLDVTAVDDEGHHHWQQPIIRQPEVGILGILVKEFDGVLHFLMQAKMEPGNPNLVQLSPTVQATRSNYTRAHRGAAVKYIEYFTRPGRGRVLADVLQSEHGSWFFRKSNRNMIVEADGDVPLLEDFRWLTLGQIAGLLHQDNIVNMDARTVLSCIPLPDAHGRAHLSDTDLLSWFTEERARHTVSATRIPLADVSGWKRGPYVVEHEEGRYFKAVGVSVRAGNREVTGWTQPLFEPVEPGVVAFLTRTFDGVPHVLAHARVEGGFLDAVELGPTVQYTPANYAHLPARRRPPFLQHVLTAPPEAVRYQAVHSEEGGRFLNAESRYLIVEADQTTAPLTPPAGYQWVTPGQLTSLVRHGHYVNVQARTLLACLGAMRPAR